MRSSAEEVEKRAALWILKRDGAGYSEHDRCALESWLAEDARHREAYLALDEAWSLTEGLKQWRPRDGRVDPDLLAHLGSSRRRSRPMRFLIAASLLLAVIAAGGGYFLDISERYSTPIGGYERVTLADGSVVQLNTDTAVRTHMSDARRAVRLIRGEAYFDVARDPTRPFEVIVGNTVARAIGTAFSVRVGGGEQLELIVTEGRVMLLSDNQTLRQPLIEAGQSARARAEKVAVVPLSKAEITRRLAWQRGQLVFDRRPLAEVAAEFNRYNRRQIRIAAADLHPLQLTGNFKPTDLTSFIAAVKSATRARVEESESEILIDMPQD